MVTTKTFRGENMLAALHEVQRVLGPEAIVVSMREIPAGPIWQVWRKPGCEIIATLPEKEKEERAPAAPQTRGKAKEQQRNAVHWDAPDLAGKTETQTNPEATHQAPSMDADTTSDDLRSAIADIVAMASRTQTTLPPELGLLGEEEPGTRTQNAALEKFRTLLLNQGVMPGLVNQIISVCENTISPVAMLDEQKVRSAIRQQLEARIKAAEKPTLPKGRRIICLVGTTGSGKTSTCARLATQYAIKERKRVAWIAADTIRAGALVEARTYTDSLGIQLHPVYSTADVHAALAATEDYDVVLMDTPGCNPREETQLVELASFITAAPQRITYLMAPATTKDSDLLQAVAAFGPFNIKGLIMSKMDETGTFGHLYNAAWHSQLPPVYATVGPQILDTLKITSPFSLVKALFEGAYGQ